jgi:GAF domain-containing protein
LSRQLDFLEARRRTDLNDPHLYHRILAFRKGALLDAQTDPRTAAFFEQTYHLAGERAYVAVSLRRGGRWAAALWISTEQPRDWMDREVELLETTAERTWNAVEKLRLDASLRESEERFRQMLVYWQAPFLRVVPLIN